jgi:hypothetical protein
MSPRSCSAPRWRGVERRFVPVIRLSALITTFLCLSVGRAANLEDAARRLEADAAADQPLVAHVIVALVDNEHQGIVPVPASLGNGADPKSNLYWGAMYGVRSWFRRSRDWQMLAVPASTDARVLDRVLFRRDVVRGGRRAEALLLAEAWRGDHIADAIAHFLELNRGQHVESLRAGAREVRFGGASHVVVFIGHNGLMDFEVPALRSGAAVADARASIVLACLSNDYFSKLLAPHSVPLLTTAGLMAPEAYTLDAALTDWFGGGDAAAVRQSSAAAYAKYQKTSQRAALRLFVAASSQPRP